MEGGGRGEVLMPNNPFTLLSMRCTQKIVIEMRKNSPLHIAETGRSLKCSKDNSSLVQCCINFRYFLTFNQRWQYYVITNKHCVTLWSKIRAFH